MLTRGRIRSPDGYPRVPDTIIHTVIRPSIYVAYPEGGAQFPPEYVYIITIMSFITSSVGAPSDQIWGGVASFAIKA